jgi:hypothetical protein
MVKRRTALSHAPFEMRPASGRHYFCLLDGKSRGELVDCNVEVLDDFRLGARRGEGTAHLFDGGQNLAELLVGYGLLLVPLALP